MALALTLSGLAVLVLLPALAAAVMKPATTRIEVELERMSEAADRLATFERNVRKVALEPDAERPVPFGGFLSGASQVKPGNRIELVRDDFSGPVQAEVVAVERVVQSVSLARPSVARMDLILVRARVIDPLAAEGDHVVVTPDRPTVTDTTLNLLFAVRPADAAPATGLAHPAAQRSL